MCLWAILLAKEDVSDDTGRERDEGSEVIHAAIWGRVLGSRNSMCKGPEVDRVVLDTPKKQPSGPSGLRSKVRCRGRRSERCQGGRSLRAQSG